MSLDNWTSFKNSIEAASAELNKAEQFHQQRRFAEAQRICEALIHNYPNYSGALCRLGLIYADQNRLEQAFDCLSRAAMVNPRDEATLSELGQICLRFGANEIARRMLEAVKQPSAKALLMLGDIYQEDCEYELARDVYRRALAGNPGLVAASIGLGWCLHYLDDNVAAAQIFEGLLSRGVRALEPLRALSVLPAQVVKIDLLNELEKAAPEPGEDKREFETSQGFFRAIALDRAGRYTEAWEQLTKANENAYATMQHRAGPIADRWRRSLEFLRACPGSEVRDEDARHPISLFILGPSRSGKTTAERLIARLGNVKRGYESPIITDAVRRTFQSSRLLPAVALDLMPENLYPLCRENYLEDLERKIGSAKVFTNTTASLIHVAALLLDVVPNARFIFLKRDIEDNLFRIYMARYRAGNAFSYNLNAARDYIMRYREMIDLMEMKFPDVVRVIHYEDMITKPNKVIAAAAEICRLPISDTNLEELNSDIGCSIPYHQSISARLAQSL